MHFCACMCVCVLNKDVVDFNLKKTRELSTCKHPHSINLNGYTG